MTIIFHSRLGRLSIILSVIVMIYLAMSHGLSSFKYNFAKNNLLLWTETSSVTKPAYESVKRSIYSATALWPNNPTYLASKASVLTWGTYDEYEPFGTLENSLNLLQHALEYQPLSPWIWSEWVMTKWRMEDYDDAMLEGIVYLGAAGPYTGEANVTIVDAGLHLMSKRPDFADRLKPLVLNHYLRSEYNGHIIRQMRSLKEDYGNPEWLPELIHWRDRQNSTSQ